MKKEQIGQFTLEIMQGVILSVSNKYANPSARLIKLNDQVIFTRDVLGVKKGTTGGVIQLLRPHSNGITTNIYVIQDSDSIGYYKEKEFKLLAENDYFVKIIDGKGNSFIVHGLKNKINAERIADHINPFIQPYGDTLVKNRQEMGDYFTSLLMSGLTIDCQYFDVHHDFQNNLSTRNLFLEELKDILVAEGLIISSGSVI